MPKLNRILTIFTVLCLAATFGVGCSKKAKAERHLKNAERYYSKGFYISAEIEYRNTLQLEHTNSRAIRQLGSLYFDQGRVFTSYQLLSAARQQLPDDLEVRLKLATLYMSGFRSSEAQAEANYVLDKVPTNAEAPLLLAESIIVRTNIPLVRARLNSLVAQVGETAPLVLSLGVLTLMDNNTNEAEQAFKRAMAIDPKYGAAPFALGNYYWSQRETNKADASLKLAYELSPPRSPRRLGYADFKLRIGKIEEGKALLASITTNAPDFLPAWVRQAQVALAEGDLTNCASLLKHVLGLDAINYDGLMVRGQMFMKQGEGAKAVAEFEHLKSLQFYANMPAVHYNLALAQLLIGDTKNALLSLNQAVKLNPNYAEAILAQNELNIRLGNSAAAIAPLTRFTKQWPQIHEGHLLLAGAYFDQRDLNAAEAVYRHAMELFPGASDLPFKLGLVLLAQMKPTDARTAFEKSLELQSNHFLAIGQLIDLDVAEKKFDAALRRVTTESELAHAAIVQADLATTKKQKEETYKWGDRMFEVTNYALATIYYARAVETARIEREKIPAQSQSKFTVSQVPAARKDAARAEAILRGVTEKSPESTPALSLLAQVLVGLGKEKQAIEDLTKLASLSTNYWAAYFEIGMIQEELKAYTAARDAYEKLLAINPKHTLTLNNLAYDYCDHLNQLDKAFELANRARQIAPTNTFVADTFGWVLFRKQEYAQAASAIQESADGQPNHPDVRYHLGMARYMTGDEAAARAAFEKALQSDKDFTGKDEAMRRLEFLKRPFGPGDITALADLEKIVADDPNDSIANLRLAAIYKNAGNFEKEAGACERFLKHNPKNVQYLVRLASLYAGPLTNSAKALPLAKDAQNLAPDDAAISHLLGRLVYQTGDFRWSQSLLQEAARKGENAQLLYDLAWADYKMGQVSASEARMQKVMKLDPKFPASADAQRFLDLVAASKIPGQALSAADQARQALAADPNYLPALMVSALVQEQKKNYGDARKTYERILALDTLFTPATRNLAILVCQYFEEDPKGYDLAVNARQAYPEDPEVARTLGISSYRRGDFSRAAQFLTESAQKRSDDGELHYYLGMAHFKLKQTSECKAALTKALALNIPGKFAAEAQKILKELK